MITCLAGRRWPGCWRRCVLLLAACGGESRQLVGYSVEPVPAVGDITLPDLSNGDAVSLRADPGKILLVYFGYTNCPDFCPNTMANVKLARQQLDDPAKLRNGDGDGRPDTRPGHAGELRDELHPRRARARDGGRH